MKSSMDRDRVRVDYNYKEYGGKMNPNKNIFFGPITVSELERCAKLTENKMRLVAGHKENQGEHKLNRNFDRESLTPDEKSISLCLTAKNNSTIKKGSFEPKARLKDISNVNKKVIEHTKLFSHSPYLSPSKGVLNGSDLDQTFDLDDFKLDEELISLNLTTKNNGIAKDVIIEPSYAVPQASLKNNSDMHKKEHPKLFSQSPYISSSKIMTCKSSQQKNCLIDDTFDESVKASLMTPLLDKFANPSRASPMKNSRFHSIRTTRGAVDSPRPVKISDTFIAEVTMPECVLISTSIDENETNDSTSVKNQQTPDIFNEKHNDTWKKISSSQTSSEVNNSFKSKLPKIKKTPAKKERYLFAKSPVAEYIHRGVQIQSLSKPRHSHCCPSSLQVRSKSDNKTLQSCKIPVLSYAAAKRKLQLGETESTVVNKTKQ